MWRDHRTIDFLGGFYSQAAQDKAGAADDHGVEYLTLILTSKCAPFCWPFELACAATCIRLSCGFLMLIHHAVNLTIKQPI